MKKVKEMVLENRHTSLKEMSSELGIAYGTAQHIVVDVLGMRRVAARLVPKDLNFVQNYLTNYQVNTIQQAPYSPDMAPCDFFLFPKLKLTLRGKRFQSIEEIKENATRELKCDKLRKVDRCKRAPGGR